jgi:pimeloyl-ACP methyl ester carboxylesterase
VEIPETRYTRSGDVNIAYQVVGEGEVDLLWIPGFAQHIELAWEEPRRRAWLELLAQRYRLITFDKRGTGLSDRVMGAPSLDVRMDDCRAVLDAAASQRATVFAVGDATDLALVFAATYPQRVGALVLYNGQYRGSWAPDWPWARPREEQMRWIDEAERSWPDSLLGIIESSAPSLDAAEREVFAQLARFRGVEHDTAGDGFFASFDGPARAIHCASAIRDSLEALGLDVRAGLHTGECELLDGKVSGIAVATGARVAARAETGEILVSQTVKDLVAGSGISFDDRGAAELKGVPGEWRLYAVAAG